MKKKLAILLISASVVFATTACRNDATVESSEHNKEYEADTNTNKIDAGTSALIEIGDSLWYDKNTYNVYYWNGMLLLYGGLFSTDDSTTPSAYYAPNGLPYKYNPESGEFYENDYFEHLIKGESIE